MEKLIILSIVLVSFAVPVRLSTNAHARTALRRVQWIVFVFIVVWAFMCLWWYPRLVFLQ
jgi:hypothetical protein